MGKIIDKVRQRQAALDAKERARQGRQAEIAAIHACLAAYPKPGLGAAVGAVVCMVAILAGVVCGLLTGGE